MVWKRTPTPFCEFCLRFQGSIISSEEENKTWSQQLWQGLFPTSSASKEALCTNRTHTHYARGEKDHACIPMHTHDISSGSQRCRGMLRGLPSGGPCKPGCKEAGWQSRVWRHLQPTSHGRPEGPWAGLGRVVGTASGMVLQASLAGGAWGGSPGRSVQGSWVAHLGAAGKGRAPQWWPWWWSQPDVVGGTSCTSSSRSR